jgi:hypothetical protein
MAEPVIGRKPSVTSKPPLGTGTVLAPVKPSGLPSGLGTAINTGLGNVGVDPVEDKEIDKIDFITNLTKAEMQQIIPYLKKFGATKTNLSTYPNAKDFLQTNFGVLVENAQGSVKKLIDSFKNEATGYGTKADEVKSNGVTQYVTKQSPALIAKDVDKFLLSTIGSKNINQDSRDKIMAEINKMIEAGTTTTSKMDKKTGKTTVTQTPGYSEERLGAVVERIAKEGEPLKYEQQKQLNFFDFMQQAEQMRGGR